MSIKRQKLRTLINAGSLIRAVGAYDAVTARLIEIHGFEALWASSLCISASLGLPDDGTVSLTELLNASRTLNNSTDLPVIADCDNGSGTIENVIRLVREFELAGLAAICIEDQASPKLNSLQTGKHRLLPASQFVKMLQAAVATRRDPDFLIIGRVEALVAGLGVQEALRRATKYVKAGADIIALQNSSNSRAPIDEFHDKWMNLSPTLVIPTTYNLDNAGAQALGVSIVVLANQVLRVMMRGADAYLSRLSKSLEDGFSEREMVETDFIFQFRETPRTGH